MHTEREVDRHTIGLEVSSASGKHIVPFVTAIDRVVRIETHDGVERVVERIERGKTWHPFAIDLRACNTQMWRGGNVAFRAIAAVWSTLMVATQEFGE